MSTVALEDFDSLFVGHPTEIEKNLQKLLAEAELLADRSLYMQILAQIAVAQAMQQSFGEAHANLEIAASYLSPEHKQAKLRIALARGRVWQQAMDFPAAIPHFQTAYDLATELKQDFFAVDAAHIMAMVVDSVELKIFWNNLALRVAQQTEDVRAQQWLGTLFNNIGQNFLEAGRYDDAHTAFEHALDYRKKEGVPAMTRGAKWALASALRLLQREDEALALLLEVDGEYEAMVQNGILDLPKELLPTARGLIQEDLALLYEAKDAAKAKAYAKLAYAGLSQDPWMVKLCEDRLSKLAELLK